MREWTWIFFEKLIRFSGQHVGFRLGTAPPVKVHIRGPIKGYI